MNNNFHDVEEMWVPLQLYANAEDALDCFCHFFPQAVNEWDHKGDVVPLRCELPVVGSVYLVEPTDRHDSKNAAMGLMFSILEILRRTTGGRVFFVDTAVFLNTLMPPQQLNDALEDAVGFLMSGKFDSATCCVPACYFDDCDEF